MGDLDSPLSADQKGYASMVQYLTGESPADRQKWRDEVLGATEGDFKAFAKSLENVSRVGSVAVVGSQAAIDEANKNLKNKMKVDKAF